MAAHTTNTNTNTNTKTNMNTIEDNIAQNQTDDGNALVPIHGNTYPIKEQLKALGGRWSANDKCWQVPASRASEARALLQGVPPRQPNAGPAPLPRDWVKVEGNTYAVKDILKAQFRARWNGVEKAWYVAPEHSAAANALAAALKGTSAPTKRCWECGCSFTYSEAQQSGGDWRDSYCGC